MQRFHHRGGRILGLLIATSIGMLGFVPPAGASIAPPYVKEFKLSATTIGAKGGTVTVSGKVSGASVTCYFSASPSLKTYSGRQTSCSSFSKSVTIPKDTTGSPIIYSFNLVAKNGGGTASPNPITLTEAPAPVPISFNPPVVNFGDEGVYIEAPPLQVTVTNQSSVTQDISSISFTFTGDYPDFSVNDNACGFVSPKQSCSFYVRFQPSGSGLRTGTIAVFDASWGSSGTSTSLSAEGTGEFSAVTPASPNLSVLGNGTPDITMPTTAVGTTTNPVQLTLTDTSTTVPLAISTIATVGNNSGNFSVSQGNCGGIQLSPNQSCTVTILFTPNGSGDRTTDLVIADNASNYETKIQLDGVGQFASASLEVDPGQSDQETIVNTGSYTFQPLTWQGAYGASESVYVVVTNTSSVNLYLNTSNMRGADADAFASGDPGSGTERDVCVNTNVELLPGGSCTFWMSFTPVDPGTSDGYLYLADNSINGFEEVNVSGTANPAAAAPALSSRVVR